MVNENVEFIQNIASKIKAGEKLTAEEEDFFSMKGKQRDGAPKERSCPYGNCDS